MTRSKSILLLIVLFVVMATAFMNCGQNSKLGNILGGSSGNGGGNPSVNNPGGGKSNLPGGLATETGNPHPPGAGRMSYWLGLRVCDAIYRCFPSQYDDAKCIQGVEVSNTLVGAFGLDTKVFPNWTAVINLELQDPQMCDGGKVMECAELIRGVDCSSPEMQAAFDPWFVNPYANAGALIPKQSQCQAIYGANQQSSIQRAGVPICGNSGGSCLGGECHPCE